MRPEICIVGVWPHVHRADTLFLPDGAHGEEANKDASCDCENTGPHSSVRGVVWYSSELARTFIFYNVLIAPRTVKHLSVLWRKLGLIAVVLVVSRVEYSGGLLQEDCEQAIHKFSLKI